MIGLALWVIVVAGAIEFQNARAGYYVPRGNDGNGKWRISRQDTPRDRLRGLIGRVGLFQYLLSPAVLVLAVSHALQSTVPSRRKLSIWAGLLAIVAGLLAVYRDYIGSLGW